MTRPEVLTALEAKLRRETCEQWRLLIAQRDELLEALKPLLRYVDEEEDDLGLLSKLKDEARAAIAKARGQS
jgi:hypothetical protein